MDNASVDPGSTAGGGKPDLPNVGFTAQGDAFNTRNNYGRADFDRAHRFSASYVLDLPTFGSQSRWVTGWALSGFYQTQSGTPFSIFAAETTVGSTAQYNDVRLGSAGLYRLAFGRPSVCGGIDQLKQQGNDQTEGLLQPSRALLAHVSSPAGIRTTAALATWGGMSCAARASSELTLDCQRIPASRKERPSSSAWTCSTFSTTSTLARPTMSSVTPARTFGKITDTTGGPRVMQFGMRLVF